MKRQTVDSSMIHAIGYEEGSQTLEVVFNSGKIYQYHPVPPQVWAELLAADSKGRYMRSEIIDCYPCQQVRRKR